jgi:hypothetical protein
MKHNNQFLRSLVFIFLIGICSTAFAQKKKGEAKLDKRRFDIEIREVSTDGSKKYEKDLFEFTPREIVSESYLDLKFKIQTMHYKVTKDSTYTDDGEEVKYWKLSIQEKTNKPDEEIQGEVVVNGKDISGILNIVKGTTTKKSYEFEGSLK